MYAAVRQYSGIDPETYDELHRRRDEIEELLKGVPSFLCYYMIRTSDGLTAVTICEQYAGTAESNRRVAEFIKDKLSSFMPTPPDIAQGSVIMHFAAETQSIHGERSLPLR